ncbi:Fe-S-cluster-containing hydrogenase subunit [Desulfosporosinus acidiphilus SJ4]|uniref:Fe-S-cluster-containing hydrogenase subunit n=1 Tax=Desulfosporosinus acidiphilus (strain DSM 22704 / JCM 16185 / SJ4) TaxID=646529 RepID=I4D0L0_DESAJ|nr:4Fe-4S dicluster domain-containing protein [Desulfosporosinus acidiphilus]AFM39334.1 Fe-S-cluster-containing hydrogenase subunit [Desulfosporosinus acidiphilus SJ4]
MRQILARSERCLGCKSCELACAVAHSSSKTLFQALAEPQLPQRRIFVESNGEQNFPLQCRQCLDSPCVHACICGAMHIDLKTGLIQVDSQKCVGCMMCVMVCPYGVIAEIHSARQAAKCDRCLDLDYNPACVSACPTGALEFTEVQDFTHNSRKAFLKLMNSFS